jgi:hypothetical protein
MIHVPPSPINITGNPTTDWAILIIGSVIVLYCIMAIRLSRDAVRQTIRLLIGGFLLGLAYYVAHGKAVGNTPQGDGLLFGLLALVFVPRRKRSRYISADVKRAVIARDFAGREHEYDSKRHHIDHKWPHSKGGGNTRDNLRVLTKEKNLKKGAKKPGVGDMFFR